MPEGPEVKVFAEKITKLCAKRKLTGIEILSGRYAKEPPEGMAELPLNLELVWLGCKGKFLYFEFANNWDKDPVSGYQRFIWSTLGLTGKWLDFEGDHARIKLDFDGVAIWFCDQRNFGTIKFNKTACETSDKICGLGLDFLKCNWPVEETYEIFKLKKNQDKTIAEILMNQENYAGVGNYIKAEVLYIAGLSPWRLGKNVTLEEQARLHRAIDDVMHGAYYRNKGEITLIEKYDNFSKRIYKKKVSPCGNPIVHEDTEDGRVTWWVPKVQR